MTILCIAICLLCVTACIFLIKNINDRKQKSLSGPETTQSVLQSSSDAAASTTDASIAASGTVPATATPASSTPASSSQTITAEQRTKALSDLNAAVKTLLDGKAGRYSVFYINLKNGETLGYKQSDPMVSASSIKIAYNTYLYKKAADGSLSMDEQMAYNAAPYPQGDLETGTGTIQTTANGTKYTLSQLSNLSITISDCSA